MSFGVGEGAVKFCPEQVRLKTQTLTQETVNTDGREWQDKEDIY
jgi:hypothetical protein